ncbi:MAG: hypothetical protein ABT15_02690 [Pseudonocardia sp. SCN 73-27]|nr:MAG: hypothetical protein ABS80_00245 [Pseudonocardia sp. SCN 72-51]ODV08734.1 MAG: hypothetical protein ABT15_02690 [Pseudonocardia sp. SCN 73-27]
MDRQSVDPTARTCADGHLDVGGICGLCGEWLPVATCRAGSCAWVAANGERTLQEAVDHHIATGHSIRVIVN